MYDLPTQQLEQTPMGEESSYLRFLVKAGRGWKKNQRKEERRRGQKEEEECEKGRREGE